MAMRSLPLAPTHSWYHSTCLWLSEDLVDTGLEVLHWKELAKEKSVNKGKGHGVSLSHCLKGRGSHQCVGELNADCSHTLYAYAKSAKDSHSYYLDHHSTLSF